MEKGDYNTIKQIEDIILNEINMYSKEYEFKTVELNNFTFAIDGIAKMDSSRTFHLIRVNIINDIDAKEVQIPIIFLPDELKYKGIGKRIISLIYGVTITKNYRLFICDLVQSFYLRLIKRGAEIIRAYDVVEITKETKLN